MIIYEAQSLAEAGCFIYELVDSRTDKVRYVGSTVNPKSRYSSHMCGDTPATADWVAEMKATDGTIIMRVVCWTSITDRRIIEQRHIDRHPDLLNRAVVVGIGRYKTKHTLAEVETTLAHFRTNADLTELDREIIEHYLQSTINQRTRSTGPRVPANKGKRGKNAK